MKTKLSPSSSARFFSFGFGVSVQILWVLVGLLIGGVFTELRAAAPADLTIYKLNEVQSPPALKGGEMRIRFSRALRKERHEITVRFVVTAEGKTSRLTIVKFSDPEMIDPTFRAYETAEYYPALKDGKPVDAWMEVTEVAR